MVSIDQILHTSKEILEAIDYDLLRAMPSDYLAEYQTFYSEDIRTVAIVFLMMISFTNLFSTISMDRQALVSILAACVYYKVPFKHGLTSRPELLEEYMSFIGILDDITMREYFEKFWTGCGLKIPYSRLVSTLQHGRILLHL